MTTFMTLLLWPFIAFIFINGFRSWVFWGTPQFLDVERNALIAMVGAAVIITA